MSFEALIVSGTPTARDALDSGTVQSNAVREYVAAAAALATRRAYQGDLRDFTMWGGTVPCDPAMVAEYMACRAQVHRPQTIARRLVGIIAPAL
jgi:hypothetical protein